MTAPETVRRHDIDALRVIAFALLIGYHVGMVYVHDWGFHIKSTHQWMWLQWPMVGLNRWRMELIFLLSGLALGLSRSAERPGRLIARRSRMLLVPLVFGMLAIVPIQAWIEARANGAFDAGFGVFLLRYWQLRPWPTGGFAGAEFGVTWNHLWYLAYLWTYTIALVPLLALARRLRVPIAAIQSAPPRAAAIGLFFLLPAGWLLFALYVLEPRYGNTKALVDDWAQHATYFPIFLFGFWLARRPAAWRRVVQLRRVSLVMALTGLATYMGLRVAGRVLDPAGIAALPDWNWALISDAAHALYAWSALLAILGFGALHLNRPFGWLPYANRAVYPWYILHQSLIVPLAWLLIPLALPGPLEATLLLIGTIAGCALLHHFVILRARLLWPLLGVNAPARPSVSARPDTQPASDRASISAMAGGTRSG
jgi:hypothetical protein